MGVELELKQVSFAVRSIGFIFELVFTLIRGSIVSFRDFSGVDLGVRTLAGLISDRGFFIRAIFAINTAKFGVLLLVFGGL